MVSCTVNAGWFFEAAGYAVRSLKLNTAEFGVDHEDTVLDAKILCKIRRRIGGGDARCAACGVREPKPKRCGGCRDARYCGVMCQRVHRADHRASCTPSRAA